MRKDDSAPQIVLSNDPGAGAEFLFTVPAGQKWILKSVSVQLVETVQTPWPSLVLDDGTNIYFKSLAGTAAMAATNTSQISWFEGATLIGGAADTTRQGTLPFAMVLLAGHRIRSVTAGIGANCDYGIAYASVEKI